MMMSYFLVLEVPPSLRGSVDLCSLGGTPSPRVQGLEDKAPQGQLVGLEPKYEVLAPIVFWGKTLMDSQHVMDEDDSTRNDDSNASKIIQIQVVVREMIF